MLHMFLYHHHKEIKWDLKEELVYSSIIRYLEPLTGDVFTAQYVNCHFDEYVFTALQG